MGNIIKDAKEELRLPKAIAISGDNNMLKKPRRF
jgi:hypothetical protein